MWDLDLGTFREDSCKDWDEGMPFLEIAVLDAVQECLGFNPSDLVFGHTVRGPLKTLQEQRLAESFPPLRKTTLNITLSVEGQILLMNIPLRLQENLQVLPASSKGLEWLLENLGGLPPLFQGDLKASERKLSCTMIH